MTNSVVVRGSPLARRRVVCDVDVADHVDVAARRRSRRVARTRQTGSGSPGSPFSCAWSFSRRSPGDPPQWWTPASTPLGGTSTSRPVNPSRSGRAGKAELSLVHRPTRPSGIYGNCRSALSLSAVLDRAGDNRGQHVGRNVVVVAGGHLTAQDETGADGGHQTDDRR